MKAGQQIARRLMQIANAATEEGRSGRWTRRCAPEGAGRRTRAHSGLLRRLLPQVGQDLGVPGPSQGAPAAGDLELGRRYVDSVSGLRVDGR